MEDDYSVAKYGVPAWTVVTNHIANRHYPVYIVMDWYAPDGAHAMLITGTSGTSVYLVDPANDNEWAKYYDLKNGTTLVSGSGVLSYSYRFDAN